MKEDRRKCSIETQGKSRKISKKESKGSVGALADTSLQL
jgi:hypothetical protein